MVNIYKVTNSRNGKVYIGQTSFDIVKRFNRHWYSRRSAHQNKCNSRWYGVLRENIKDIFIPELIESVDSSAADEREIYWIKYYKSTDPEFGYNIDDGGRVITTKCRDGFLSYVRRRVLSDKQIETINNFTKKAVDDRKPVLQIDKRNFNIIKAYDSILEASNLSKGDRRSIQRQLKNPYGFEKKRARSTMKFIWCYVDDYKDLLDRFNKIIK